MIPLSQLNVCQCGKRGKEKIDISTGKVFSQLSQMCWRWRCREREREREEDTNVWYSSSDGDGGSSSVVVQTVVVVVESSDALVVVHTGDSHSWFKWKWMKFHLTFWLFASPFGPEWFYHFELWTWP